MSHAHHTTLALKRLLVGALSLSLALGPAPAALAEEAIVEADTSEELVLVDRDQADETSDDQYADEEEYYTSPEEQSDNTTDTDGPSDPEEPGDPSEPTEQLISLSNAVLTLSETSFVYDGTAKEPVVTVELEVLQENEPAIEALESPGEPIVLADDDSENPLEPVETTFVQLTEGIDYTVAYENNTDAGTASVIVTGTGAYEGTASTTFAIERCSISKATVSGIANVKYNGKAQTQSKLVVKLGDKTLRDKTDYTVSYKNNKNAGKAIVTITGVNNYRDKVDKSFAIKGTSIAKAKVSGIAARTYNGKAQGQKPTVKLGSKTLKLKTDYTLSYKNNVKAGTATVVIKGCGAYEGSLSRTFKINKRDFSKAKLSSIGKKEYTGKAITPAPTVKWGGTTLKKGTDYTVSYKNNKKAGKATVTVTGKGNYSGAKKSTTFTIYKRDAKNFKVSSISTQSYTGSAIKPTPTVKWGSTTLKRGTDYTLSYKNNKYGGTATITITGKGRFTGSKSVKFKINGPKYYGKTVYITDTGIRYHRAGCRYLYSKHACDKGEAIWEGYTACKVCKP